MRMQRPLALTPPWKIEMTGRQADRDLGQARQFLTLVLCGGSLRPQERERDCLCPESGSPGAEVWKDGREGIPDGGQGHCVSKSVEMGLNRNVGG